MEGTEDMIQVKKLREKAVLPSRATVGSAGVDLCACIDESVAIPPEHDQTNPARHCDCHS